MSTSETTTTHTYRKEPTMRNSHYRTLVVIPNYNGLRFLPDCMEALSRQTVTDFTVLVIDNASG